ncbi:radical SAM protein [bacterium]|nr:radical SAM protein [bacterium]
MSFEFQQLLTDLNPDNVYPIYVPGHGEIGAKKYLQRFAKAIQARQQNKQYPMQFQKPLGCQLELTDKCNQKCIHCYNRSGEKRNLGTELSINQWKDIARQLGEAGIFECIISGGEPLMLGKNLYEIMDILSSYGIRFIFITNGMLLDEKVIKKLTKYRYAWIQLSIDGSRPNLHNWIRGAKGSWKRAVKAAFLVKEAELPLVIAHVVMKQNIDFFEEMVELSYNLGAKRLMTGSFIYAGRAILNANKIKLTKKDKDRLWAMIKKKADEYVGKMEVVKASDVPLSLRHRLIQPNSVLLIRPNGDVRFSCEAPFRIGNVLNNTVMEIWENIGKNVLQNPTVIKYVQAIKCEEDILTTKPRPYVDNDILLR